MSDDNKWSQPEQPPPPLFLGQKEKDLVKQVNDELLERVIGQQIAYYPIDRQTTNYHPIYGEAINKNYLPPVRVYALVEWKGVKTDYVENFGISKKAEITVKFHKRRLTEDQDLYVREGDYVLYGDFFFEITSLEEAKQLFGQITHDLTNSFQIIANCTQTTTGIFDGS